MLCIACTRCDNLCRLFTRPSIKALALRCSFRSPSKIGIERHSTPVAQFSLQVARHPRHILAQQQALTIVKSAWTSIREQQETHNTSRPFKRNNCKAVDFCTLNSQGAGSDGLNVSCLKRNIAQVPYLLILQEGKTRLRTSPNNRIIATRRQQVQQRMTQYWFLTPQEN